jgi:diacylglycerol kinase (ATP)
MKRVLLLVNRGARKAEETRDRIQPALEARGLEVMAPSEHNPSLFMELMERFRDHVDAVVVAGGDGTCLCVADTARRLNLPLGIVPMGTANNLARSLGIAVDVDAAADTIAQGHTRQIDMGLANGKPFLNVSGLGLSTQVNRRVPAELKKRWGVLAYALYFFKWLRRMRPFWAEIECDGKIIRARSLQITVCNGRHYGSGLTIAEDAAIDDGRLDLISAALTHWWEVFRLLPAFLRGRYRPESGVKQLSGRSIRLRTRPSLAVDTDGEVTTRTPVEYELITGGLTVFAPRPEEQTARKSA